MQLFLFWLVPVVIRFLSSHWEVAFAQKRRPWSTFVVFFYSRSVWQRTVAPISFILVKLFVGWASYLFAKAFVSFASRIFFARSSPNKRFDVVVALLAHLVWNSGRKEDFSCSRLKTDSYNTTRPTRAMASTLSVSISLVSTLDFTASKNVPSYSKASTATTSLACACFSCNSVVTRTDVEVESIFSRLVRVSDSFIEFWRDKNLFFVGIFGVTILAGVTVSLVWGLGVSDLFSVVMCGVISSDDVKYACHQWSSARKLPLALSEK